MKMFNQIDIERCKKSFSELLESEKNEDTKKMLGVLIVFCDFVLGKRKIMYYPNYDFDPDLDIISEIRKREVSE